MAVTRWSGIPEIQGLGFFAGQERIGLIIQLCHWSCVFIDVVLRFSIQVLRWFCLAWDMMRGFSRITVYRNSEKGGYRDSDFGFPGGGGLGFG